MFITLAGNLGSGKSTICAVLAKKYGFAVYSTGAIHREIADRMGIGTLELNEKMREDDAIDRMIDSEVERIAAEKAGEDVIFDSRLAWRFAPSSFKVFARIDPSVAARRVRAANRGPAESYVSDEDALNKLAERARVENERFLDIYGVDNLDMNNYDLILDTTSLSPDESAEAILLHAKEFERSPWPRARKV